MGHFDGLQAIAGAELPLTSALYLTRLPDYIFGRTFWLNLAELLRYIWLKFPLVALTNVLVSGEQEASLPALREPYWQYFQSYLPAVSFTAFYTFRSANLVRKRIISTVPHHGGGKMCPHYITHISTLGFLHFLVVLGFIQVREWRRELINI